VSCDGRQRSDTDRTDSRPGGSGARVRGARIAVAASFALNGALFGVWASRVPAIKSGFGLGEGGLGLVLLALAAGAIVSFPVAGVLSDRLGAARLSRRLSVLYVLAFTALGAAAASGSTALLIGALALFGAGFGSLDVAMNGWAAEVERDAGRPLMSGFHALFSLGAGVGAGSGFLATRLELGVPAHFWIAAAVSGACALVAIGRSGSGPVRLRGEPDATGASEPLVALPRGALLLVGLIAFGTALGEGALADWSAVYLVDVTGAGVSVAALGYAAFSLSMVLLRLAGDRIVARLGPPHTVRASAAAAFAGIAIVVVAPGSNGVIAGFALMGAGYAIVMPLAFSRAAADPHVAPGIAIAGVATLAYGGMLLGPPAIGGLAELFGLRVSFAALAPLVLVAFALARHVAIERVETLPAQG